MIVKWKADMRPTLDGIAQPKEIMVINSKGEDILGSMSIAELTALAEKKRKTLSSYGGAMYLQVIRDEIGRR